MKSNVGIEIRAQISKEGLWYELPNYKALSAREFIASTKLSNKLKTLIETNVNRIQRQCDTIAIELV